jgi:hypothetical protein
MTDATSPHDRLAFALARVLANGSRPPCGDGSGAWVSDNRDERAMAARLCARRPLIVECAEAADSTKERFGVWAGVDPHPTDQQQAEGGRVSNGGRGVGISTANVTTTPQPTNISLRFFPKRLARKEPR